MLNIFPQLLTYSLFAPTILRITVGLLFLASGILLVGKQRVERGAQFEHVGMDARILVPLLGLVQFVGAGLLILGLWTQIGALILIAVTVFTLFIKSKNREVTSESTAYLILLLAALVSLLFSGAGFIAFDLPL